MAALSAFVLLGLHCAAADLRAQTLRGVLLDHADGRTIHRAVVTLSDTTGAELVTAVTDRDGRFVLAAPEPGTYLLRAAAIGYERLTVGPFQLAADEGPEVELPLTASAIPIPGLRVEVERARERFYLESQGFYRRQKRGFGRFFTPEEIEKVDPVRYVDLLPRAPGVYFDHNGYLGEALYCANSAVSLSYGGDEIPQVYIDGVRIVFPDIPGPGSDVYLDPLLPVQDVAAIEIYKGGATTPVEFSATGSSCTVLIWTKGG